MLLLGPTGTGKELFARALHERSRRHARPLVRVNCAALPPTLVESELFGHEKGAFTGAVAMRQGRFELADGGTIFLDEIGDLPPDIQVKFLRVLQEGEFERVGSSRTKTCRRARDCRHPSRPRGRGRAGTLPVGPVLPPERLSDPAALAARSACDDIPRLVWFFIHRHQRELGRHITKVPQAVMDALQHHAWPGNVRELENVVERAMIASSGDTLQLDEPLRFNRAAMAPADASDNLDAVQRLHIESVLQRCGWRINGRGQRRGAPRHPSEHAAIPHEEAGSGGAQTAGAALSGSPGAPAELSAPASPARGGQSPRAARVELHLDVSRGPDEVAPLARTRCSASMPATSAETRSSDRARGNLRWRTP